MADYIRRHGLTTTKGQAVFEAGGNKVDFPLGRDGGSAGAAVLKMAWKIIDPKADKPGRFFTRPARIAVKAADSSDGKPHCHAVTLALVGLHIMRRTKSGNGDRWIWSTFEHADNAPYAADARGPNSILTDDLFPSGCKAAKDQQGEFSFFNGQCPDCPSNAVAPAKWTWASAPPFAGAFAQRGRFGTQVARCWRLSEGTEKLNKLWHAELAGTVWRHYHLVSTQWRGNYGGGLFNVGEVPRYLTNSVLETYLQTEKGGTCLGCHTAATTKAGADANFTFVFDRAH